MRISRPWLGVIPLLFLVSQAPGGGKVDESAPALIAQVRSLEHIFDQARLILSLIDREEIADQVDGLLRAKVGPEGVAGIDHKKPAGLIVHFGKEIHEIAPLLLIPIADEQAFLEVLKSNKVQFEKGKKDLYTARIGRDVLEVEVYFRFARGYLFATVLSQDALTDKRFADPANLLNDKKGPAFSLSLRIDQVPLAARQIALAEFEKTYNSLVKELGAGADEGAREFAAASLESVAKAVESILAEGHELKLSLDVGQETKKLTFDFALTGKSGSGLAKEIEALGKRESRFAGLMSDKAMFNAVLNLPLPEKMRKGMAAAFDEMRSGALADLTDKEKRLQAEALFAILEPTFTRGPADAFFLMNVSEDKTLDYLVALGVKDGKKLEKTLRGLVEEAKKAMPEKDRNRIRVDFAKEGEVSIHRLEIPEEGEFAMLGPILGEPYAYFAFQDDAAFLALGKGGMESIKMAVSKHRPGQAPLVLYRADMNQLLKLAAPGMAAAEKWFPAGADNMILIRIEGGPALTGRVELPLALFMIGREEAMKK